MTFSTALIEITRSVAVAPVIDDAAFAAASIADKTGLRRLAVAELQNPKFSRPNFRPTHHTSEKSNTEYTSATVQADRIASTVISYTFLVLVHVQESYLQ